MQLLYLAATKTEAPVRWYLTSGVAMQSGKKGGLHVPTRITTEMANPNSLGLKLIIYSLVLNLVFLNRI